MCAILLIITVDVTSQNIPDLLRSDVSTSLIETLENTEAVGRQDSSLCIHERMFVVMKAGIMTHDFKPKTPGPGLERCLGRRSVRF